MYRLRHYGNDLILRREYIAALISMGEIVIYVLGLNLVLKYLTQPSALIVYAVGYGLGVLLGA